MHDNSTKRCTKCGVTQPLDNFSKHPHRKDGKQSNCRSCVSVYNKQYREKNRAKLAAADRAYYETNKVQARLSRKRYREENAESLRVRSKQYYEANRDREIARRRQNRLDNPERSAATNKRYYERTRDQQLERSKQYRKDNRERLAEYMRTWRLANPDKRRAAHAKRKALKKGARGEVSAEVIYGMAEDQEWLCAYCETPLFGTFHVDHMIPLSKGGPHDWTNIAITCPACNLTKRTKTAEEFMAI